MADNPAERDDELLLRMRSGDEQSFATLYRRKQGSIYRFAWQMTGSPAVAEDITQEVFLALIRDECGYDPERGSISAYLFGIARKLALRHLERRRDSVELDEESDDGSGDMAIQHGVLEDLTKREGLEALRRAVEALPRRYREVVALCDLEEVDYADAAAALGCPIGTVRSRLHRARALLLDKLTQKEGSKGMGALKPARCSA